MAMVVKVDKCKVYSTREEMNILLVTYLYKVEESLTCTKNLLNEARDAELAGLSMHGFAIKQLDHRVSNGKHCSVRRRPFPGMGENS